MSFRPLFHEYEDSTQLMNNMSIVVITYFCLVEGSDNEDSKAENCVKMGKILVNFRPKAMVVED